MGRKIVAVSDSADDDSFSAVVGAAVVSGWGSTQVAALSELTIWGIATRCLHRPAIMRRLPEIAHVDVNCFCAPGPPGIEGRGGEVIPPR